MSVTPGLVGTVLVGSSAGTSATPVIPGSITTSHYMVATVAIVGDKHSTLNTPAGWTMLGTALNNSTGETLVNYGRMYQAGDSNPVITWTTSNRYLAVIHTYLGVDTGTQLDVAVPTYNTGTSTSATSPAATAATHGALRIHCHAKGATGAATPDGSMTEIVDSTTTGLGFQVCYETDLANGNGGTRISTIGSTTWVASTIILRPATPAAAGRLQSSGGHASSSGASTFTITLRQNGTSGSAIMAYCGTWTGGTNGNRITSVDYNSGGTALTLVDESSGPSNNQWASMWQKTNNTNTGTIAVVAHRGGGSDDITMWVEEWAGLDTSTLVDQHTTNNGTSATASVTQPTMSAGNKVEVNVVISDQAGITATGDSDFLVDFFYNNTADISIGTQHRQLSGGSGDTITWGVASGDWASVCAALNVAAAGGTTYNQTCSATSTTTPSVLKQAGVIRSATSTTTTSVVKAVGHIRSLTSTLTASVVKSVGVVRAVTSTVTPSVLAQKVKLLTVSVTVAVTPSVIKSVQLTKSITSTVTTSVLKSAGLIKSVTTTSTASVIKSVGHIRSVTVTITASNLAQKVKLWTSSVTSTVTASLTKQVSTTKSMTATGTASIQKAVGATRSATSSVTASIAKSVGVVRSVTTTATASVTKCVGAIKSATVTATASIVKAVGVIRSAASTAAATVTATFHAGGGVGAAAVRGFRAFGYELAMAVARLLER